MKQTLTRQRNALRTKLKGYLSMVVGDHAQKELDNDIFMEDEVIPEAPSGVAAAYWTYRSIDFHIRDAKARKHFAREYNLEEEMCFC